METVRIPKRVDDAPHILLWSLDELAPLLIGLVIGVFISQIIVCTLVGYSFGALYTKYRDSKPDAYMFHMLYYYGFWPAKGKSMVNPFIKRYFP